MNLYGMVGNDAINLVDLLGMHTQRPANSKPYTFEIEDANGNWNQKDGFQQFKITKMPKAGDCEVV